MKNQNTSVVARLARPATLVAVLLGLGLGCGSDDRRPTMGEPGGGATETNVAPALCSRDEECPEGIECRTFDGGDGGGFCDVNEMSVEPADAGPVTTSPAPALCVRASDCPPGIECRFLNGQGSTGFCVVAEMLAP
jgi:hypothetical protein